MRKLGIAIIAIIVLATLLLPFRQGCVWDGQYMLNVTIVNNTSEPIESTRCKAFGRREDADFVLEATLKGDDNFEVRIEPTPFTENPIEVSVWVCGHDWMGIETRRTQDRYLVVVLQFQDGKRSGKVAEIPDLRASKSLAVTFP